jgi:molybdopterin-guanine dinucleotide biosynthesis protein A
MNNMFDVTCVIFAGGKSSRMGEDKSLLPFGEFSTLIEFQVDKLSKIFSNIYISCKNKNKFKNLFNNKNVEFIEDTINKDIFAPTAGFVSVYDTLKVNKFFVLSVDSPFVNFKEIIAMLESDTDEVDATIAKTPFGLQAMCGIYHRSLEKKFIKMLNDNKHKLGHLLKSSNVMYIDFEDDKSFLNLNNPQEYQEALKLI